MRKINFKLIVLQVLALVLLIAGVQRLFKAFQADKYQAIWSDWENFQALYSMTVGELLYYEQLLGLAAFLLVLAVLAFLNRKRGVAILNTILIFVSVLTLFLTGFFSGGVIKLAIDSFWGLMTLDYQVTYFIAGTFLFGVGLAIVLKSLRVSENKGTIHNNE